MAKPTLSCPLLTGRPGIDCARYARCAALRGHAAKNERRASAVNSQNILSVAEAELRGDDGRGID